jgi:ABC-2 type transport system ATP-binding protein
MADTIVIETEELTKKYDDSAAVDRLSLRVPEGEIFGFLGPNGAGKTTTILMLLGLTEPTSGKVRVLGYDPVREPVKVKRQVGYLQENMGFYRDLNARQMLQFIAELNDIRSGGKSGAGVKGAGVQTRIERALESVGLAEEADKKIGAYSRGMRQRLGLAEILLKEPRIAIMDEPTLGLDPDATNHMLESILALSREKRMTVLLSSHMLNQVQRICHRVGIMIGGRMVTQGTMEQLAAEKIGVEKNTYTLEEIYMKYFKEAEL